jgi:nucleoside-diphosphate-sugar epimerase
MTVLITGGGGFLGAWIAKRLHARGVPFRIFDVNGNRHLVEEIVGSDAKHFDWRVGDISSAADVDKSVDGCEAVVHLAGLLTPACQDAPVRGAEINLIGTLNVFEAAKRLRMKKVVYMSSVSVFGPDDGVIPFPTTHYGAFKLACEGCARTYWEYDRISSVGLRPSVVYGPGRESGLTGGLSLACKAAAEGKKFTIGFVGATDMVYADDVAAMAETALLSPLEGAHVFNAVGEIADVEDVIAAIRHHEPSAQLSVKGSIVPFTAQIGRDAMRKMLPGLPHTRLADGIAATIDHYRKNDLRQKAASRMRAAN